MLSEFIEENAKVHVNNSELEKFVDDAVNVELGLDSNEPIIENRTQADYYLSVYKNAQKETEDNLNFAKDYLDRQERKVREWLEKVNREPIFKMEQAKILLEDYTRNQISSDSKKKSIKLINGSIGLRARQLEYSYDDDVLRKFLKDKHDEFLIKQPDKIDHVSLKKVCVYKNGNLTIDDEIIPGIDVEEHEDSFVIK